MVTDQILQQAIKAHQEGKLEEAEKLYKKMTKAVFNAFKNKNINIPKAEGYSLKDASIAHDILESRRGGGSLFLKP